ncbi:hypothetical protein PTTG_05329 [Puccinia triticina 1-1 BBBD Race 1]|uniref:Myb_DNA-bind_3 domain-containing protein n=1 Tax=Puccinia triticina (isolate 1-1 / race 1 (BBBD)) TaxID=630390 RepID=A0A180H2S8_PUCT1|nr:hypothetical protein PTTG_05329 [Puccinia triticina 1-1 BBBD Race 1]
MGDKSSPPDKKTPPHWWTAARRTKLLELIDEQIEGGKIQHTAWNSIRAKFNKSIGANQTVVQPQNQRAYIRDTFLNYRILRHQPGFTWDSKSSTLAADKSAWDRYPHMRSLQNRPFPMYELADRVFRGPDLLPDRGHQSVANKIPASSSAQGPKTVANPKAEHGTAVKEEEVGSKKRASSLVCKDGDSDIEVLEHLADPAALHSKRARKGESAPETNSHDDFIKPIVSAATRGPTSLTREIPYSALSQCRSTTPLEDPPTPQERQSNGVTGKSFHQQIHRAGPTTIRAPEGKSSNGKKREPADEPSKAGDCASNSAETAPREDGRADPLAPLLQDSVSARALKSLADLFLDQVDERHYIRFVRVLENHEKAAVFLVLVHTSNKSICLQWLDDCVR